MEKISKESILKCDSEIFGEWTENVQELSFDFNSNKNFPHIVIENFLKQEVIEEIHTNFPDFNKEDWWEYNNPIEVKYANDKIKTLHPVIQNVFNALSTEKITDKIKILSGINDLEHDPTLHGAGLHLHPRNGRLLLHLDYEKHPVLENKQRRLNIILYLSKNWKPEWNGSTELWNKSLTEKIKESPVVFNSALIFQTTEESWHGVPLKIMCPSDIFRKSLAFYYISPLDSSENTNKFGSNSSGYREKASFSLSKHDKQDERLLKLMSTING